MHALDVVPDSVVDLEFDRQVQALIDRGWPDVAGSATELFQQTLEPLRALVHENVSDATVTSSRVPFVLVVPDIDPEPLVPLLRLNGGAKPGILDRNHGDEGRAVPAARRPGRADIAVRRARRGAGEEFCDVRPNEAVETIRGRGRTPLTIHEGIALVTVHPQVLEPNRCFMLAGSRRGDRRVPALWISQRAPKLGWCWEGNPHSWLGTASAGARAH